MTPAMASRIPHEACSQLPALRFCLISGCRRPRESVLACREERAESGACSALGDPVSVTPYVSGVFRNQAELADEYEAELIGGTSLSVSF